MANEWLKIKFGDNIGQSLPPLPACSSAIIDPSGSLVVGLYEKMPVRLSEDKWLRIPCDQTVLSLASTSMGIIVGGSEGKIALLEGQESNRLSTLQASEPILNLIAVAEEGIVALGAKGGLWVTEWPYDAKSPLRPIDLTAFERPLALYKSVRSNYVLLMGANRLALLHFYSGSIRTISGSIWKGLRNVCVSPNSSASYSVLTDFGALHLVSRDLQQIAEVKSFEDKGEVAGVRAISGGRRLVWTTHGNLYIVEEDGTSRYLVGNHVVMAFALPGEREILIISWQESDGARLQYDRIPG